MDSNNQEPRQASLFEQEVRIGISTLNKKIDDISNVINGRHTGMRDQRLGVVGVVDDHEERIAKLEKFKNVFIAALFGAGLAAGWGITAFLDKFF